MKAKCIRSLVAACAAAGSFFAFGETYYADFHGTRNGYAYNWYSVDNWKVKDGGGNLVTATTIPQEGDDVIVNSGCGQMSANDGKTGTTAYLNSMMYNAVPANSFHQGYVGFLANHPGLKVADGNNIGTWAGLAVKGSGDFVVDIGAGGSYNNQKGIQRQSSSDQITLVKKGAGSFNPVYENNSEYRPIRTILMGGTFTSYGMNPASGHALVFGSNDGNIRLRLSSYTNVLNCK